MLKIAKEEQLPSKLTREITLLTTSVVLIDYQLPMEEESAESWYPLVHWRVGDGTKPPIDLTLYAETGRLRSLEIILQDETIERRTVLSTELTSIAEQRGVPIFERTLWKDDEEFVDGDFVYDNFVDEQFSPVLSWTEQNNLLVVWQTPPVQVAKTCSIDESLTLLFNEQEELVGCQVNKITREEKAMLRRALLQNAPEPRASSNQPKGFDKE